MIRALSLIVGLLNTQVAALRYDPNFVGYNLNENQTASDVLDYWGTWENHTYASSPSNWRFPFYSLFLDKWVNGDPTNDNINGTLFEHDMMQTQLRHGGDLQGLIDSLDYIQGIGIKAVYIAGSPMINMPWGADQYSPLDFSLLDMHFGNLDLWRQAVDALHSRGMYVILDNTMATMGDLIAFNGYVNSSTPFLLEEHNVLWRNADRTYLDFSFSEKHNETCSYPRFWFETGFPVGSEVTSKMKGCYDSDFDQYGDTEAFGVFPDWQRQLSKFASVQDRLREWVPSVREKISHFACMEIMQLDIDGFRVDKATQITVDALGEWSHSVRECARSVGKENFMITGEITGGNTFGSIYLGRGRQPDMVPKNLTTAVSTTNKSSPGYFIRDNDQNALDSVAFHYSIYRSLTRFLGMDGNLASGYDTALNWVDAWNQILLTNDLVNANTGAFDPRHMFGTSNQDVFRWPAITNGTYKQLLGMFITTLHMPGIPLLLWGEEQAFYLLDNTADNYIFGRQAMSASTGWRTHGCYTLGSVQFNEFPMKSCQYGCNDPTQDMDHRDPTHPVRNIIKAMYQMRETYPVLQDGWFLQQLSNNTHEIQLPGSSGVGTETGIWSTLRSQYPDVQDLSTEGGQGDQPVWLVYHNDNQTVTYNFDCTSNQTALISPFLAGTTAKNLFFPYDEVKLIASSTMLHLTDDIGYNGCLQSLEMIPWEFKAYVPKAKWVRSGPMVTSFSPGHDARLNSTVEAGKQESLQIIFGFSDEMSCSDLVSSMTIVSKTEDNSVAQLDTATVKCQVQNAEASSPYPGSIPTTWKFTATLTNVSNGVHSITLRNIAAIIGSGSTKSNDTFLFRIGQQDNPIVFPRIANYTRALLHQYANGSLYVSHKAAGADSFRYSLTWGSTYSVWQTYYGGNSTLETQPWSGTKLQEWSGEHVIMEYFSRLSGSSDYIQHADLAATPYSRRLPHLFAQGPYNQYGYDMGIFNRFNLDSDSLWKYNFMTEWPAYMQLNVWGMNPDGEPDKTIILGDVDGDMVLDRMPPSSLATVLINITNIPPKPYLGWTIVVNDGSLVYRMIPYGNRKYQIILAFLFMVVPVLTGGLSIWLFMKSFYAVKFNDVGVKMHRNIIPWGMGRKLKQIEKEETEMTIMKSRMIPDSNSSNFGLFSNFGAKARRTILIATMEYDIEDWHIKIKIGGLGVMAQLMGKNLGHQNLIWVVPCVGGIDYPEDQLAEPMSVTTLGKSYTVQVQYHTLRNITYVLLDAPVFRVQTELQPYPARMDDLDSAIYYSSWNQCIALAIQRFPVDIYHINDYHGALAPIHLLPRIIPVCLSLHNAEFQGLWPMRTKKEIAEVCSVYNLSEEIAVRYVQFGDVFNLLHAGSSYIRIHQKGFGVVGVSKKYGKRSWARYPIFWELNKIGNLPNPDPTDTAEWTGEQDKEVAVIDEHFESRRAGLKRQSQEWAGLDRNPKAELLVFVGRWSKQKGIDLIADVMPSILEENSNVQLITIGPVIDLYGKFAALKLDVMMKRYKGRVFSKPIFTALPQFVFSGAEFVLIPSRDEPFGLVAVEFGRKGALGIGARVGGLGQMPGWWYTVESTTTTHLLHQFKMAIKEALDSKLEIRQIMRARSAKQRFPVLQWVHDLQILQSKAIRISEEEAARGSGISATTGENSSSRTLLHKRGISNLGAFQNSSQLDVSGPLDSVQGPNTTPFTPVLEISPPSTSLKRALSLGSRRGPGHRVMRREVDDSNESVSGSVAGNLTDVDEDYRDAEEYHRNHDDIIDEYVISDEDLEAEQTRQLRVHSMYGSAYGSLPMIPHRPFLDSPTTFYLTTNHNVHTPDMNGSETSLPLNQNEFLMTSLPNSRHALDPLPPPPVVGDQARRNSSLSLTSIIGGKTDFNLQKVDPFFTDTQGEYYDIFAENLEHLDAKNSEDELCVEKYLVKSEKEWFNDFHKARLGRSSHTPTLWNLGNTERHPASERRFSVDSNFMDETMVHSRPESSHDHHDTDQFLLGNDYTPPTGLRLFLQYRYFDWPVYSFLLAFGQIIAANSYQITLLTGTIGETATRLYITATIYLVSSIIWWFVFIRFKSMYCLSAPFIFYGLAFCFLAIVPWARGPLSKGWFQNVATGFYTVAASSGSLYFALNFGDEGGAPVKAWIFRACVLQGTQQIYVVVLWYWGAYLNRREFRGLGTSFTAASVKMTAVTAPIAVLMWAIGLVLFLGLPDYYREQPGKVPSFYWSLVRRKIVMWFFVYVLIQNFFLSTLYGRNWLYLFASNHAPTWAIVLLIVLFFGVIWGAVLYLFSQLSKNHSWILPIFAIGLGAPRWCQMLWSCTPIGQYLPWLGFPLGSALVSRSLWLWLGMLDALQGVGFGMLLLQTLTRTHIAFTLIAAQGLGSIATIVARACAPNNVGPGDVFPDFTGGPFPGLGKAWFWVGLVLQFVICGGFFAFFRKEQLSKP